MNIYDVFYKERGKGKEIKKKMFTGETKKDVILMAKGTLGSDIVIVKIDKD